MTSSELNSKAWTKTVQDWYVEPGPPLEAVGREFKFEDLKGIFIKYHIVELLVPTKSVQGIRKQIKSLLLNTNKYGHIKLIANEVSTKTPKAERAKAPEYRAVRLQLVDTKPIPDANLSVLEKQVSDLEVSLKVRRNVVSVELLNHAFGDIVQWVLRPFGFKEFPHSYETIGHIAHLNLREEHQPFSSLLGQVLILKNPSIRTVVSKTEAISSQFRVLPMQVIAGESQLVAKVKEGGVELVVQYDKVYWNSRLSGERSSLKKKIAERRASAEQAGLQLVFVDLMGGIGALSVMVSQENPDMFVICNDLNTASVANAIENTRFNKVSAMTAAVTDAVEVGAFLSGGGAEKGVLVSQCDGRDLLHEVLRNAKGDREVVVVMNLPEIAYQFLDVLNDFENWESNLHFFVHCFAPKNMEEARESIEERLREVLDPQIFESASGWDIVAVRDIGPTKLMWRIEISLNKNKVTTP